MWKRHQDLTTYKYALVYDVDTANNIQFEVSQAEHRLPVRFDLNRLDQKIEEEIRLTKPKTLPFAIKYFRAYHTPDVKHAVGVRLRCLHEDSKEPVTIGYTGDTAFFQDLANEQHVGHSHMLLAHISEPDIQEYDDPEHIKQHHLGYRGLARLIRAAKPKLTLIGEFWAGFDDVRIQLAQALRHCTGQDAILPTSIGMRIRLTDLHVRCTTCKSYEPHLQIVVAPPSVTFGPLAYLCKNCRLEMS